MPPQIPELGSRDLDEVTFGVGSIELPDPVDDLIKFIVGRHRAVSQQMGSDHFALYAKPVNFHEHIVDSFKTEITGTMGGARIAVTSDGGLYFSEYSDDYGAVPSIVVLRFVPLIREHVAQLTGLPMTEKVRDRIDPRNLQHTHPFWMTFAQVVEDLQRVLAEHPIEYSKAMRKFEMWQEEMREAQQKDTV